AVLQPQELAQQSFLGTAKLRHVGAVVRSAQHRRQRNDQNVDQIVPRIVRSRVRHVLEKVLEFLHRTTPIPIRESSSESISPASATPPLWPNAIPLPTRGRVRPSLRHALIGLRLNTFCLTISNSPSRSRGAFPAPGGRGPGPPGASGYQPRAAGRHRSIFKKVALEDTPRERGCEYVYSDAL